MTNRHPSKALVALLSFSLIFIGTAVATAADYPPKPGEVLPPAPGNTGEIIKKEQPLNDGDKVVVPKAPESNVVLEIKVKPPTKKNLESLHSAKLEAVEVQSGLVLGGVGASRDLAKVVVDTRGNSNSEIQAPRGTPISISLGGYTAGEKVTVIVTQNGKSINLGVFVAGPTGKLTLPAATLTGTSNETFSFKSKGNTEKVILRPTAAKSGFSTLKAKFSK